MIAAALRGEAIGVEKHACPMAVENNVRGRVSMTESVARRQFRILKVAIH
jgi:hypothetical protein